MGLISFAASSRRCSRLLSDIQLSSTAVVAVQRSSGSTVLSSSELGGRSLRLRAVMQKSPVAGQNVYEADSHNFKNSLIHFRYRKVNFQFTGQ